MKNFSTRFWVLNVVAHELAHQWFGNIVTLDWWVDVAWVTLEIGVFQVGPNVVERGLCWVCLQHCLALHRPRDPHLGEVLCGGDPVGDVSCSSWFALKRNQKSTKVMNQDQDTRHHWAMTDPVTTRWPTPSFQLDNLLPRDDIDRKFGDFTYLKGGSFNRMVSEVFFSPINVSSIFS